MKHYGMLTNGLIKIYTPKLMLPSLYGGMGVNDTHIQTQGSFSTETLTSYPKRYNACSRVSTFEA